MDSGRSCIDMCCLHNEKKKLILGDEKFKTTEKLNIFSRAVNGYLIEEKDFVLANTEIPTNTFNVLLPRSPHIKEVLNIRSEIESFSIKEYPFRYLD